MFTSILISCSGQFLKTNCPSSLLKSLMYVMNELYRLLRVSESEDSITRKMSRVTCHAPCITHQASRVLYHVLWVTFQFKRRTPMPPQSTIEIRTEQFSIFSADTSEYLMEEVWSYRRSGRIRKMSMWRRRGGKEEGAELHRS